MEELKTQFTVSFQTFHLGIKQLKIRETLCIFHILDKINRVETVVTDQMGRQLNLRGENLTNRYHLREIELHIINVLY